MRTTSQFAIPETEIPLIDQITTDELLSLLAIVRDRPWEVTGNDQIRSESGKTCPICALVHEITGYNFGLMAASAFVYWQGYGDSWMEPALREVIAAADNAFHPRRADLKAALGFA